MSERSCAQPRYRPPATADAENCEVVLKVKRIEMAKARGAVVYITFSGMPVTSEIVFSTASGSFCRVLVDFRRVRRFIQMCAMPPTTAPNSVILAGEMPCAIWTMTVPGQEPEMLMPKPTSAPPTTLPSYRENHPSGMFGRTRRRAMSSLSDTRMENLTFDDASA